MDRAALKLSSGLVLSVVGLAFALIPMRPSPAASVGGHVGVLLLTLAPATLAVTVGGLLLGRAGAISLPVAAIVLGWVILFHPVSDLIPDDEVPAFERVYSLQERAARGEPFRRMDGHWYQVKPWIARILFF